MWVIALPISAYNPFTQDPNCFSCNQHFEADAGDLSAYDLCPLVSCGCCDRDANGLCNAAGNRGPSREGVSKVMLVLTDGEQTIDGDDSTAIAMARPRGWRSAALSGCSPRSSARCG